MSNFGKGSVSDGSVNHHKQMAMGKTDGGASEKFPPSVSNQKTGGGELAEGARGVVPHDKTYGQQRAPDHGDMGKDHHRRGAKL